MLIAKSEDELQLAALQLNKVAKKYDIKILVAKTKGMGL
jgi:hypothetical protein